MECLYAGLVTCYLVAKTVIHANSVRKIIISIHKIAYGGENTHPYPYQENSPVRHPQI